MGRLRRLIMPMVAAVIACAGLGLGQQAAWATSCATTNCQMQNDWVLQGTSKINGVSVRMRENCFTASGSSGHTLVQSADTYTSGSEQIEGGFVNYWSGGTDKVEFYAKFSHSNGSTDLFYGHDFGDPDVSPNTYYYVNVQKEGSTTDWWDVDFYDANLNLIDSYSAEMTGTGVNGYGIQADTGLNTDLGTPISYGSESNLNYLGYSSWAWTANWDTASSPGSHTGFWKDNDGDQAWSDWTTTYSWMRSSLGTGGATC